MRNNKTRLDIAAVMLLTAASICATGCSTRGEQAAVQETADQIEQAHIAGRESARPFLNKHFKDSLELQQELVRAGVKRAEYDSLPQCRAAYDSAFISTVRTVNPEMARELSRRSGR